MDTGRLKRHVFFELLGQIGRVYILVRPSPRVMLGKRGFTEEEKEKGITLVFSPKMNVLWDDEGVKVTLVFGTRPQKCFIPAEEIVAIYSPEAGVQLLLTPAAAEGAPPPPEGKPPGVMPEGEGKGCRASAATPGNVVQVDFVRRLREKREK